ncbi:hypothetical protein NRA55_17390 [Acinetobacter baumannii]|uniref:hypothetical protein n=1 Tax=Acinetobacter baumannii TaxID=470 RepID=UPI002341A0A0|nr:hypothetical protein [Acinetobacter baumannii]MDC5529532.1 hypothetical protein [Acinetobacter baumannii]
MMFDLNKEREAFEGKFPKPHWIEWDEELGQYTSKHVSDVGYQARFEVWLEVKAQAVPDGWAIVPQELPLDMALKIAKERILEQPPVKDPVLNEILEKAHKENIQSEQCRLMRDYKEMVKRLSELGADQNENS